MRSFDFGINEQRRTEEWARADERAKCEAEIQALRNLLERITNDERFSYLCEANRQLIRRALRQ